MLGGRPSSVDLQEALDGILYVLRSGCPWRILPHDIPAWQTAYKYIRRWSEHGTWERVNGVLRSMLREAEGQDRKPGVAIKDGKSKNRRIYQRIRLLDSGFRRNDGFPKAQLRMYYSDRTYAVGYKIPPTQGEG